MVHEPDGKTGKRRNDEATKVISDTDVPPGGSLGVRGIRSVDLEPRSNGENDWQDERPPRKHGTPAARR